MSPTNPTIVRKTEPVMTCPACQGEITADARIRVTMQEPVLGEDGQATVPTTSVLESFHITHRCVHESPRDSNAAADTKAAKKAASTPSTSGSSEGDAGGDAGTGD